MQKPTDKIREQQQPVPDIIQPNLTLLFCGINPGLYSAETGFHFAHPGNRFWPALHQAGFTPRQFKPSENQLLLGLGFGIVNLVDRPTKAADELTLAELRQGKEILVEKINTFHPQWVAIIGIGAYRQAFGAPHAQIGPQPALAGAHIWVLPQPSGLNAHYTPVKLAQTFRQLHSAINPEAPHL